MTLAVIRLGTKDDPEEALMLLARERDGAVESYSNSDDGRALKDYWEYVWSNGIDSPMSVIEDGEFTLLAAGDGTVMPNQREDFLGALSMELHLQGWRLDDIEVSEE